MKRVLINTNFIDVYTGILHEAGTYEEMTEERIAEIKAVNPNFVDVVGNAESNTDSAPATPVVEPTVKSLTEMTKKELIEVGRELGLELTDSMKKDEMIEAIENAKEPVATPVVEPTDNKPSADDLIDDLDGQIEDIEE